MTKIVKCSCASEFQDSAYGAGLRLHNFSAKNSNWRCTVCKSEKLGPKEDAKKKGASKK